ncbi:bifunctional riboflavin kinase/FAD synthetase [Pseudoalteromonas denitrificans]|uniref:Riboflavin biosynthesis protein n=1 Tax=Pseudoalteromonas denitrificans DSM 6059 TaxID=1123010 RepID=A0A1I1QQY9_9GAMM|nr:bifunctional riboflavin kinase/FAD synthetase [Pseudoalteromonas denitrificans]SFD24536.1 riboflavin kinase / FMN adenylyltransferase [Pseudoalteromonas denitrificans DSM 6059]
MELIRGIHNIRSRHRDCVLTIGNFDGVHLGHEAVLNGLINDAKIRDLPSTVMLFEPQPQELFAKGKVPPRLTRLRDKLILLKKLGIKRVICINFNHEFANLTADYFIREILINKLGVKALTIGDDFRFGKGRVGDFNMLVEIGGQLNMAVKSTRSFRKLDCRVSSTAIRSALAANDIEQANDMLGHAYQISGRVIHGCKQGRQLGFPTANVALKRQVSPVNGVFAVKVKISEQEFYGVANVGSKPTLNGQKMLLEVHIFNFKQDIYGTFISVELINKLRNEQKFDTLEQLIAQIDADVKVAKQCFGLTNI